MKALCSDDEENRKIIDGWWSCKEKRNNFSIILKLPRVDVFEFGSGCLERDFH